MSFSIKSCFKVVGFVLGSIFAFFICMALFSLCHYLLVRKEVRLNDIHWIRIKDNIEILEDSNNKTLVGPGSIELWGKYPYLVGDILANGTVTTFMVDVRSHAVTYSPDWKDMAKLGIRPNQYVTFSDLKGQLTSRAKREQLLSNLKKPSERKIP